MNHKALSGVSLTIRMIPCNGVSIKAGHCRPESEVSDGNFD